MRGKACKYDIFDVRYTDPNNEKSQDSKFFDPENIAKGYAYCWKIDSSTMLQ